ncbi:three-Cys-motif partner protein TcmP [Runella sp.]|uniref:three-Cys-motif partner protein TcmP n=1 Tax=Runella sp. TaxID=1960881 RepID=UPI003D10C4EC
MSKFSPIIRANNDGLALPEIGSWAERKYKLVGTYCDIFTNSMKNNWKNLVYIDLFSGAGYAKIKDTNKIIMTSALIAMSTPFKFNKYILCEMDKKKMDALKFRALQHFPELDISFIEGDTNQNVSEIQAIIHSISMTGSTLCFAFVDPFSLNLHFSTIRALSKFRMDFLILLAIGMDFNRNLNLYLDDENEKIVKFLDNKDWRKELEKNPDKQNVMQFLSLNYDKNMVDLGYVKPTDKHQIRSDNKNLPLYHLAFYSKHKLGNEFWKKVQKYGQNQQLNLFE